MIQISEILILPIFTFGELYNLFSGDHIFLSLKASSLSFCMMLYGSEEKRLFGELSSSCCFPLSCSVCTRPSAFMQDVTVVLSMEFLALAKENLFFMKLFHVREKRRCF